MDTYQALTEQEWVTRIRFAETVTWYGLRFEVGSVVAAALYRRLDRQPVSASVEVLSVEELVDTFS